VFINQALQLHC